MNGIFSIVFSMIFLLLLLFSVVGCSTPDVVVRKKKSEENSVGIAMKNFTKYDWYISVRSKENKVEQYTVLLRRQSTIWCRLNGGEYWINREHILSDFPLPKF